MGPDPAELIETLGIPVAVAFALLCCCGYLIRFITKSLTKKLDERFERLEKIVISLIDSNQAEKVAVERIHGEFLARMDTLIDLMAKLHGVRVKRGKEKD